MITVATLVYRNINWIKFLKESLDTSKTNINYKFLVLANDATEEINIHPLVNYVFKNQNPNEYYINRVYRAWNKCVEICDTDLICLINSDMYVSDYWLDELYAFKTLIPQSIPCGTLVESGRIPSAMPEYVKNFGLSPNTFDRSSWIQHSNSIRRRGGYEAGKLYSPVLFSKKEFLDIGGYPEGNINGIPGDQILFNKYKEKGYNHITCLGSIVYHTQEGEMRDN